MKDVIKFPKNPKMQQVRSREQSATNNHKTTSNGQKCELSVAEPENISTNKIEDNMKKKDDELVVIDMAIDDEES